MRLIALLFFLLQAGTLLGADAPGLEARFYPEKETYILGEPIFLNIEVVNNMQKPVTLDNGFGKCEDRYDGGKTKMPGAKRRFPTPLVASCYGGGWGGGCAKGSFTLQSGAKQVEKLFLTALFSIDSPGTYKVQARRRIEIYADESSHFNATGWLEVASDFDISVVPGTDEQLRKAFERYVQDLTISSSSGTWNKQDQQRYKARDKARNNAIDAITTMAPLFLEDVILRLAEAPNWEIVKAIPALGHLNTERTRKRLAELAVQSDQGALSQPAVGALAKTHDPSALAVLMQIGSMADHPARSFAIQYTGLYGNAAIPYLAAAINNRESYVQVAAIRGLGATASRTAVPILIDLLKKSEHSLLRDVRESLAQLTHLADGGDPTSDKPRPDEWRHWREWWALNGATAKIFDTNQCSEAAPLP
jgi:hypothetical protein